MLFRARPLELRARQPRAFFHEGLWIAPGDQIVSFARVVARTPLVLLNDTHGVDPAQLSHEGVEPPGPERDRVGDHGVHGKTSATTEAGSVTWILEDLLDRRAVASGRSSVVTNTSAPDISAQARWNVSRHLMPSCCNSSPFRASTW